MDDHRVFVVAKAAAEFQMLKPESNQGCPRLTKRDDVAYRAGESRFVLLIVVWLYRFIYSHISKYTFVMCVFVSIDGHYTA